MKKTTKYFKWHFMQHPQTYIFLLMLYVSLLIAKRHETRLQELQEQEQIVEHPDTFNIALPAIYYKPTKKEIQSYNQRFKEVSKPVKKQVKKPVDLSKEQFVEFMIKAAVEECKVYTDIPPALIVAQAILESGFGQSRLAKVNNLFGHKFKGSKADAKLYVVASDDKVDDKFTIYRSKWASIRHHSKILMGKYRKRIKGTPTLDKWLEALCGSMTASGSREYRAAGGQVYATSCMTELCYAQKLKNIINTFNLVQRCR